MLKAIYVGDENIWSFMKDQIRPDWDWQVPIPTPDALWDAIDNGQADEATAVIVVSPQFYNEAMNSGNADLLESFQNLVFTASQSALVMIINFWPELQSQIDSNILAYAGQQGNDQGVLGKYWWINPQTPLPDVDSAVREYINSEYSDPDTAKLIAEAEGLTIASAHQGNGMLSNAVNAINDKFNNNGYDDYGEPQFTNNYGKKGQIITVTSSKGGAGKTTVSLGTGEWISLSSIKSAQKGLIPKPLKVCVVDLDVHDSQIGSVIGKWQPTILEVALNGVNEDTLERTIIHDSRSQCDFLLSPKLPNAADTIPPTKFDEIIKMLQYMYDIIVLDTSVEYTSELLGQFIYPMSDRIIFVTTLDRRSVTGLRKWILFAGSPEDKGGAGVDLARVSVVINRGQKGVKMTRREIEDSIRTSTQRAYQQLDMTIPVEDQHTPKLIGVIPDIPNGLVMKSQNELLPVLALSIPPFEKSVAEFTNKIVPIQYRGELLNLTSQDIVLTLFDHDDYHATWDSDDISDSDMGIDEDETGDLNNPQTGSNAPVPLEDSFEDYETITEDPDDDDSGDSAEDAPDDSSLKFEEVTVVHNDNEEDDGSESEGKASVDDEPIGSEDEEPIGNAIAPKDDDLDLNGESETIDADETETVKHDESQDGGWEEVFRR